MKYLAHLIVVTMVCIGCEKTPATPQEPVQEPAVDFSTWVPSSHPGGPKIPPTLPQKLTDAVIEKQKNDKEFRTKHKTEEGPTFTNRLVFEASPYLQQHAHNPVNWYPWSDEAFEIAEKLGRPVFLSVGYSTCHWCHVMEEESFEDLEIAEVLNTRYIAVKVDREERPDVDEIYMNAVRMLTGRGGWPMSVWMTPDRIPFAGGTYFPPRTGARGSRVGFLELLNRHADAYASDPETAMKAQELAVKLAKSMEVSRKGKIRELRAPLDNAFFTYERSFDSNNAGWGNGNKFPHPARLRFLLRYARIKPDSNALSMVTQTLDAMMNGGLYDHVGGGFHRYTVDMNWTVPHFEKMLYDNAQLITLYSEAYQVTKNDAYKTVVQESVDYLLRDMKSSSGAFYAATDADSGGEEGTYFVWRPEQMIQVLGEVDGKRAATIFGVSSRGNFEHKSTVLTRRSPQEPDVLKEVGSDADEWLTQVKKKLYNAREKREKPHRDEKVITAWNGLALHAIATAGHTFGDEAWLDAAQNIATGLRGMKRNGTLHRSRVDDRFGPPAFSEDYAFAISGFITLFEATSEKRWLEEAVSLQKELDAKFWDPKNGGYFRSASDDGLLVNAKPSYDGAVPSANSIAAQNLNRLDLFFPNDKYGERRDALFEAFGKTIQTNGASVPSMLIAIDFASDNAKEVVVVKGDKPNEEMNTVMREFHPNLVRAVVDASSDVKSLVSWVDKKVARNGKTTAYVCHERVCKLPTSDPEKFRELLRER